MEQNWPRQGVAHDVSVALKKKRIHVMRSSEIPATLDLATVE